MTFELAILDGGDIATIAAILVLILFSAFFSGSETALTTASALNGVPL